MILSINFFYYFDLYFIGSNVMIIIIYLVSISKICTIIYYKLAIIRRATVAKPGLIHQPLRLHPSVIPIRDIKESENCKSQESGLVCYNN